jgi:hypothetical protein
MNRIPLIYITVGIIVGSLVGGLLLYFLPVWKKGVADDY